MAKKKSNIIAIVSALAIFASCSGCGEKAEEQPATEAATTATTTTVATTEATTTTTKIQPNTVEMVAKIYGDADVVSLTGDDVTLQRALDTLRALKGHLHDSNENMYSAMYYGEILYYAYNGTGSPYEQAGYYACRAVENVYTGAATTTGATTRYNTEQFEMWIDQCPNIGEPITTTTTTIITTTTTTAETTQAVSLGMQNALKSAKSYIEFSDFSYLELIEQLEYEKYTHEEAVYGADHCGADWMQEAAESAASYLKYSSFSRQELYEQLLYEQFTPEQAEYALRAVGY